MMTMVPHDLLSSEEEQEEEENEDNNENMQENQSGNIQHPVQREYSTELAVLGTGPSFEELVDKVQNLQRTDHDGKLKWMSYALQHGNGRYDPRYHSREYILNFFQKFNEGSLVIDQKILLQSTLGNVNAELFVGNLPQKVTEEEIEKYFDQWGPVRQIELKEGRGFCFVTYADERSVTSVVEHVHEGIKNNHILGGQWVDVKRAEDRRKGGNRRGYSQNHNHHGGKDECCGPSKGMGPYWSPPNDYFGKGSHMAIADKGGKGPYFGPHQRAPGPYSPHPSSLYMHSGFSKGGPYPPHGPYPGGYDMKGGSPYGPPPPMDGYASCCEAGTCGFFVGKGGPPPPPPHGGGPMGKGGKGGYHEHPLPLGMGPGYHHGDVGPWSYPSHMHPPPHPVPPPKGGTGKGGYAAASETSIVPYVPPVPHPKGGSGKGGGPGSGPGGPHMGYDGCEPNMGYAPIHKGGKLGMGSHPHPPGYDGYVDPNMGSPHPYGSYPLPGKGKGYDPTHMGSPHLHPYGGLSLASKGKGYDPSMGGAPYDPYGKGKGGGGLPLGPASICDASCDHGTSASCGSTKGGRGGGGKAPNHHTGGGPLNGGGGGQHSSPYPMGAAHPYGNKGGYYPEGSGSSGPHMKSAGGGGKSGYDANGYAKGKGGQGPPSAYDGNGYGAAKGKGGQGPSAYDGRSGPY